ncbi:hypothetical protein BJ165DRAFT_1492878 [Panaeolus papilionaceus]|nr:hypothetical protein BJ165DRAFT_1492878 [Panaeolus papilionaceus]
MHLWNACGDSVSQTLVARCARTPLSFRLPHPQLPCRSLLPPALVIPLATLMQRLHLEHRPQLCLTWHPLVKAFEKSLPEI